MTEESLLKIYAELQVQAVEVGHILPPTNKQWNAPRQGGGSAFTDVYALIGMWGPHARFQDDIESAIKSFEVDGFDLRVESEPKPGTRDSFMSSPIVLIGVWTIIQIANHIFNDTSG